MRAMMGRRVFKMFCCICTCLGHHKNVAENNGCIKVEPPDGLNTVLKNTPSEWPAMTENPSPSTQSARTCRVTSHASSGVRQMVKKSCCSRVALNS